MDKIKENKNIIIGILTVLFVVFIIYNSFIKEDVEPGMEERTVGEKDSETRKMIQIIDKIDKIKIDPKFFHDKPHKKGYLLTFNEFLDYDKPIPQKTQGKPNPFVFGGVDLNDSNNTNTEDDSNTEVKTTEKVQETIIVE